VGVELEANYVGGWYFSIGGSGSIDATIDYSHSDTFLAAWIAAGECTAELWNAEQCEFVATSFEGPDPRVVSANNQTEGTYTLIIWNGGIHHETVSFQVVYSHQLSTTARRAGKQRPSRALGHWGAAAQKDLRP
jgi:hypothetical protein